LLGGDIDIVNLGSQRCARDRVGSINERASRVDDCLSPLNSAVKRFCIINSRLTANHFLVKIRRFERCSITGDSDRRYSSTQ